MNCCPFILRKEANMKISDKIRIKMKIEKICKVLYQLPEAEQAKCMNKIVYCLRLSDDWKKKEHFLDMLVERFGAICQ